jgi:hypothetical protein
MRRFQRPSGHLPLSLGLLYAPGCLLGVSGNRAVACGPITSETQPTPAFNYMDVVVQDNRPHPDTGSVYGQYWNPAPSDCSDVGYEALSTRSRAAAPRSPHSGPQTRIPAIARRGLV